MKLGFLFSGQGSQFAQMGQDLYRDQPLYKKAIDEASDVLDMDLSDPEVFDDIDNAQVAILTMSYGIHRILQDKLPKPSATVGLSLGEYSALVSAKALSFPSGLKLVHDRSNYMDQAGAKHPGAMAAVLKATPEMVQKVCDEIEGVYPANFNTDSQTVIGGTKEGVKEAKAAFKAKGIKRVIPLKVKVASHTPLMQEASDELSKRLEKVTFDEPEITVMSNTLAEPFHESNIKETLTEQLVKPTHLKQDLEAMNEMGIDTVIEIGPGTTLSKLAHKTMDKNVSIYNVESSDSLKHVLDELGGK